MAEKTEISELSKKVTAELLKKAGVEAKIETEVTEEAVKINIIGDDLGILIGFHGETLKSLQVLLGVLINREAGGEEWKRVLVDVGSWRESRQTSIEEMARLAITKVKETGSPYSLPPMSPDERRLIHLYLQEDSAVTTISEGEGSDRHIVISLK